MFAEIRFLLGVLGQAGIEKKKIKGERMNNEEKKNSKEEKEKEKRNLRKEKKNGAERATAEKIGLFASST